MVYYAGPIKHNWKVKSSLKNAHFRDGLIRTSRLGHYPNFGFRVFCLINDKILFFEDALGITITAYYLIIITIL
jgi:hypothetical protein